MRNRKGKTVILIPSLEPDERLLPYVQELHAYGFSDIVIVDDGSGEPYQSIFQSLVETGCILLRHEKNKGKGKALKTGFRYVERTYENISCIVTVDSDGQHAAEDVYRVSKEAKKHPDALTLGVRDFSVGGVPPKSLLGNRVSSFLFAKLFGKKLSDTQTGLRSFGPQLLAFMQKIHGARFEYELQMLISCIRFDIPIRTLPIQVIYEDNNSGTHFKAVQDSVKIMGVLFNNFIRFISSSLTSAVVDIGIAWFLLDFLRPVLGQQNFSRIFLATIIARVISIIVNYFLNKNFVFRKKDNRGALWRYLFLCAVVMLLSSTGVYFMHTVLFISDKSAKLICDATLFLLSYQAQQRWVFAKRSRGTDE